MADFNFGNDLSPDEKNLLFQCLLRNQDVFEKEGEPLRISNILEVTPPLTLSRPRLAARGQPRNMGYGEGRARAQRMTFVKRV